MRLNATMSPNLSPFRLAHGNRFRTIRTSLTPNPNPKPNANRSIKEKILTQSEFQTLQDLAVVKHSNPLQHQHTK